MAPIDESLAVEHTSEEVERPVLHNELLDKVLSCVSRSEQPDTASVLNFMCSSRRLTVVGRPHLWFRLRACWWIDCV